VVEGLGGNFLQDRVAQSLSDFLIASSLALSKAQDAQDLQADSETEGRASSSSQGFLQARNDHLSRVGEPSPI